ncbi:gluconate 2-dehydrogenase subunit 3 family protein [Alteromonas sp. ASW11-36]|uniref:Gluconate 2-dehydrogenase subunit 3 family protein n=1 Tax=Alteromonas arenosi TaxID=3055817 RepID=A0ABT7SVG3_9ALTE|nr:gluconate 2-dehydrogenase subunit 3 family protein [Alteromonas sp. ASW11-36]MDM7860186.1 gluconate 2-dehydrogenase subunit 3 family protein [Alteromonas sp. ASW11-36]
MSASNNNTPQQLNERRWFIKRLGQVIGATGAAALATTAGVSSALAYTPRPDSAAKDGAVLTKEQLITLRDVCATVLPKTDTPSAADVDCHGFIDHQLSQCHSVDEQQLVVDILEAIEAQSEQVHNKPFSALTHAQQTQLLVDLEALNGFVASQKVQFKFLKQLLIFGYFTSEIGATQALVYQAVPGGYKGSIPATPSTRSWGSLNYY